MKKNLILHPILFAIAPILALFSRNVASIVLSEVFIPLFISISLTLLLWLTLSVILKSKEKAGIFVALFLMLFFSYGHFRGVIASFSFSTVFWRDTVLLILWGGIFVLGSYFIFKIRGPLDNFTKFLNVVSVTLIVIPLIYIGIYMLRTQKVVHATIRAESIAVDDIHVTEATDLPNIYYIILDGYAREDVLRENYQFDNSEFINYLESVGFYVAGKSRSNYSQTSLSLASSLNSVYLDDLVTQIGVESDNQIPLHNLIKNNRVAKSLRKLGYTFVAFPSGYLVTEIDEADVYMTKGYFLREFQNVLINTTPIPVLLEVLPFKTQYDLQRERILYIFDQLMQTTEMESPIFVFAHLLAPHPPFVFDEYGSPIVSDEDFSMADGSIYRNSREEYVRGYTGQLAFVNNKLQEVIDSILLHSSTPSVIILQADHGPRSLSVAPALDLNWENLNSSGVKERMSILNAYYFPSSDYDQLYDEITPVNTFRVVFNRYFGTHYELLEDRSYYTPLFSSPYAFDRLEQESQ